MPALIPPAAAVLAALALGVATALPVAGQSRPPDEVSSPARVRYDAIRALREGRYAEVLELTRALAADADVLLVRGRALAAIGKYDEAATAFAASIARVAARRRAARTRATAAAARADGRGAPPARAGGGGCRAVGRRRGARPRRARRIPARPLRAGQHAVSRRRGAHRRRRRAPDRVGRAVPRQAESIRGRAVVPGGAAERSS